ncbi:MAG TPA: alpha-2-macroglobulin, partial [Paracoccus sp. (in: a-proteobacteria)]|nr:alpha-2-macroglobulin [Paracoccus sp. (in: a-proteobacteria)]
MLAAALTQARTFAAMQMALPASGADRAEIGAAESQGDRQRAMQLLAAYVARDDLAQDWIDLSRLTYLQAVEHDREAMNSSAQMAINGYLRAADDAEATQALYHLSQSLIRLERGPDVLASLRLAQQLAPQDGQISQALENAEARFGMRVTDSRVEADGKMPRFCAVLSRELSGTMDYAPFLRLPAGDLTVEADGQQLCVAGLAHGANVEMTLRSGLPSADGEELGQDVTLKAYIRDRAPEVRFPGRAYVLPASGDQRLAMVTVNADLVNLRLLRISDRNLIRTMSESMFATPLDSWQAQYFSEQMAREIWQGTAEVARPMGQEVMNRELTTSLAIPAEAGPLEPGIYILEAHLANKSVSDTGLATQWFVISDFGISTFSGTDGLTVAVRSLRDTGAKPGAEVAL